MYKTYHRCIRESNSGWNLLPPPPPPPPIKRVISSELFSFLNEYWLVETKEFGMTSVFPVSHLKVSRLRCNLCDCCCWSARRPTKSEALSVALCCSLFVWPQRVPTSSLPMFSKLGMNHGSFLAVTAGDKDMIVYAVWVYDEREGGWGGGGDNSF